MSLARGFLKRRLFRRSGRDAWAGKTAGAGMGVGLYREPRCPLAGRRIDDRRQEPDRPRHRPGLAHRRDFGRQAHFQPGDFLFGQQGAHLDLAILGDAEQGASTLSDDLPRLDRSLKRSEEHTSALQSLMRRSYAVFCLKKKHSPTKNKRLDVTTITTLES